MTVTIDGQFLFGAAALVIALTGALAQWRIGRKTDAIETKVELAVEKVEAVHTEVQTHNGMETGATIDAIYSQGIAAKDPADRTERDEIHQQHMADNDPTGQVAADQAAAAAKEK